MKEHFTNNIIGSQIGNTEIRSGTGTRTISDLSADITPINGTNYFHFVNSSTDENSAPYLDYFELQYGRDLTFNEGFEFCSPIIGQNVRFIFSGTFSMIHSLWEISNPAVPKNIPIFPNGYAEWAASPDTMGRFVFFASNNIPEISGLVLEPNFLLTSLRNTTTQADYIII